LSWITHKNQAVKDAIAAAGLTLRYLPRYSPDFSPIEPCWSKINLRAAAARTVESLEAARDAAVASVTADGLVRALWLHDDKLNSACAHASTRCGPEGRHRAA
jgi:transposase